MSALSLVLVAASASPSWTALAATAGPVLDRTAAIIAEDAAAASSASNDERSHRSMNCWSTTRALFPAKRRYSSKMATSDQRCTFRKQPTRQPVRCLPWLQWMSRGWLHGSSTARSAARMPPAAAGAYTVGTGIVYYSVHYRRTRRGSCAAL